MPLGHERRQKKHPRLAGAGLRPARTHCAAPRDFNGLTENRGRRTDARNFAHANARPCHPFSEMSFYKVQSRIIATFQQWLSCENWVDALAQTNRLIVEQRRHILGPNRLSNWSDNT
jgi:hypothetical protein